MANETKRPAYVTVDVSMHRDEVRVIAAHASKEEARHVCRGRLELLPVYYRRGSSAPAVGDVLPTFREASQLWALAAT